MWMLPVEGNANQRIDNDTAGTDGVGMGLILHHKSLGRWVFSFLFLILLVSRKKTFGFTILISINRCSQFGANFASLKDNLES
jgi:hypothetical protein